MIVESKKAETTKFCGCRYNGPHSYIQGILNLPALALKATHTPRSNLIHVKGQTTNREVSRLGVQDRK